MYMSEETRQRLERLARDWQLSDGDPNADHAAWEARRRCAEEIEEVLTDDAPTRTITVGPRGARVELLMGGAIFLTPGTVAGEINRRRDGSRDIEVKTDLATRAVFTLGERAAADFFAGKHTHGD